MLNLTNAKLLQNLQILSDFIGRVDIGGDTTVTINSLANEDINAYDTLCVLSGTSAGLDIAIESFDNGELDLGTNDNTLAVRDIVGVLSIPFDSYIKQAEKYIENDLRNKGAKLENFLNEPQLEQMHIYKTLSLICGDRRMGSDTNDSYHSNYERFQGLYATEFSSLLADYDTNEDGVITTDEELIFKGQVGFIR